ncbi:hypothetical protein [Rosistilla oblonga]|uniref:Uncharacterized protein n=1 Tax=Rosistilla oblonga TaxID=2527990 RepID=A0A518ITL8_9BACT|nr:hypothetical protein [Rosistilla oblonga]QDV56410.1 hypothetical protein Mal33_24000 [Rosistilla oblonga]
MMPTTREWIKHLDLTERVESISRICPDFPELVVERFRSTWDSNERNKNRAANRLEAFRDDSKPALPLPAHLGWEHELFEFAFQEALDEVEARVSRQGKSDLTLSDHLIANAVAPVHLDVGLELSIGQRPDLPNPSDLSDSIHEPVVCEEPGSHFDQWLRLGFYESHLTNESFDKGFDTAYTDIFSSLVSLDDDGDVAKVRIPLTTVDSAEAWSESIDCDMATLVGFRGALTAGFNHCGYSSHRFLLAVNPVLISALGLRAGPWPGPLTLMDNSNEPAVVMRAWKSQRIQADSVGSVFRLNGCELLLRPDILSELEDQNEGKLRYVQRRIEA